MRLRNQCSKSEAKNTKNDIPKFETIEVCYYIFLLKCLLTISCNLGNK